MVLGTGQVLLPDWVLCPSAAAPSCSEEREGGGQGPVAAKRAVCVLAELTDACRDCGQRSLDYLSELKDRQSLRQADTADVRRTLQGILQLGQVGTRCPEAPEPGHSAVGSRAGVWACHGRG